MKQITLDNGFAIEAEEACANDMEFLEMITEIEGGNNLVLPKAIESVIGKEGKKKLYDSVRDEHGRVAITTVIPLFAEILGKLGEKSEDIKN